MHTLLTLDAPAPQPKTETTNPDNYRPVGDQAEIQSPERLLVGAYALIWIILFGVVILAYLRTRALSARLEVIEIALAKRAAAPEPSPKRAAVATPKQAETEG